MIGFCGIGLDSTQQQLWGYDFSSHSVSSLSVTGNLIYQIEASGEGANDMDIEVEATTFSFAGSTVTPGQKLFVNGETGTADIYVIDPATGLVTDSLITDFGASHLVGVSIIHLETLSFWFRTMFLLRQKKIKLLKLIL